MQTIAVVNQKGGVGKSTTAEALIAGLSRRGYAVLGIDLDAQGNLSYTAGASSSGATALGVLTGEVKIHDAIRHNPFSDFEYIIPSSPALAGADAFIKETGKEYRLKEALEELNTPDFTFNYVVIDTPPALGILTVNALTAANTVIIPAQADIYSLQGIEQLIGTMQPIKKYCNPGLEIGGILLTRYNPRTVLSQEVTELADQLAKSLDTKLFNTTIREGIAIKEAQARKESIFGYAPAANVTTDYSDFIDELLKVDNTEELFN